LDGGGIFECSQGKVGGSTKFPYVHETGLGSTFQGNKTIDDIIGTTLSQDHEHVILKHHKNINNLSCQKEELILDIVIGTTDSVHCVLTRARNSAPAVESNFGHLNLLLYSRYLAIL
jgi:hypothetical protein